MLRGIEPPFEKFNSLCKLPKKPLTLRIQATIRYYFLSSSFSFVVDSLLQVRQVRKHAKEHDKNYLASKNKEKYFGYGYLCIGIHFGNKSVQ